MVCSRSWPMGLLSCLRSSKLAAWRNLFKWILKFLTGERERARNEKKIRKKFRNVFIFSAIHDDDCDLWSSEGEGKAGEKNENMRGPRWRQQQRNVDDRADLINIIFRFKKIKNFTHSRLSYLRDSSLVCVDGSMERERNQILRKWRKKISCESVPPMLVTTDALKRLNYLATARLRFSSVSRRRCCSTAWEAFAWNYFSSMD